MAAERARWTPGRAAARRRFQPGMPWLFGDARTNQTRLSDSQSQLTRMSNASGLLDDRGGHAPLGFEPVVEVVPVRASALLEQPVRHLGDDRGWCGRCQGQCSFAV